MDILTFLSCFSCVLLFATLCTIALQSPLSMGFSRQNTGVGCHAFLQGIFSAQGSNLHLLRSPALAGKFFIINAMYTNLEL